MNSVSGTEPLSKAHSYRVGGVHSTSIVSRALCLFLIILVLLNLNKPRKRVRTCVRARVCVGCETQTFEFVFSAPAEVICRVLWL